MSDILTQRASEARCANRLHLQHLHLPPGPLYSLLRFLSVTFRFGQTGTRDERIPHKQDTTSLVHESASIRDADAFPRSGPIAHRVSSSWVSRMTQPRLLKRRRSNFRVQKAAPIIAETGVGSTPRRGRHRCAERRQTVAPFFSYLDGRSPCALTMRLAALLRGPCVEVCMGYGIVGLGGGRESSGSAFTRGVAAYDLSTARTWIMLYSVSGRLFGG